MDRVTLINKAIKNGNFPDILYKYRSMNRRTDEIISNSNVWFSNPLKFNDPFDFQIEDKGGYTSKDIKSYLKSAEATKTQINKIMSNVKSNSAEITKIIDNVKKRVFSRKGVLCLSKDPKNILMWSHYSEDHTGLVLGFKLNEDPEFFLTPLNVKYRKSLPSIDYLKEKMKIATHCMQRKHIDWEYEKEVRIVKDKSGKVPFKKESLVKIIVTTQPKR